MAKPTKPVPAHPNSANILEVGPTSITSLHDMRSIRTLQEAVVKAARNLASNPGRDALLLLINPDITAPRLKDERAAFDQILRPEIRKRLHIVESRNQTLHGLPRDASPELQRAISNLAQTTTKPSTTEHLGIPDYNFTISQIIFHQWLKNAGPMTGRQLAKIAGCSYPTVVRALQQFKTRLKRHSNRTFEMSSFHDTQWQRMLANSETGRHTIRYVDVSGSPRSPENLFKRVQKLNNPAIAVGGTFAAAHAFREFNLIGNPRLDLTIHCPQDSFDLDFIDDIDVGLKRSDDLQYPANLVLHFIRRRESFFTTSAGTQWADPIECLMDLADLRLVEQADQYYEYLLTKRKEVHG